MDSFFAFFLVFSIIGGVISAFSKQNCRLVKPSRNLFSFLFFDRY
jgi:hypothetical protein